MASVRRKKFLFPLNKNSYSTSRNDGLFKKVHFHFAEKLLSLAGIYIQRNRRKQFSIVGKRLLYIKWLHPNLNNGFTSPKSARNKRALEKSLFPLIGVNSMRQRICFHQPEKQLPLLGTEKSKETSLPLISVIVSSSRRRKSSESKRMD